MFCILYCLVGIPLTLLLLSCLTHALLPRVTHAPIRSLQIYWGLSHNSAALLHCGMLVVCTAVLFFLLPAVALCLLERDWSFLESLYYCFISLSTIGLGDYLPGRTHSQAAQQGLEFATSCESFFPLSLVIIHFKDKIIIRFIRVSLIHLHYGSKWEKKESKSSITRRIKTIQDNSIM